MLNDVPYAKQYVLMPVEDPNATVFIGDTRIVGEKGSTLTFSQLLMDEIAKVMTDDDVVGMSGVTMEKCLIIVNFSKQHCYDILNGGLTSVLALFEEHPQLIPEGWDSGVMIKDWEDIPDEEKAGNPKNPETKKNDKRKDKKTN